MMFSFHTGHSSTQDQASREPRLKRAKIRIACNVCKTRKTKCDGAKPICGPCSRRKRTSHTTDCVYRETDSGGHSRDASEGLTGDPTQTGDDDGASSYSAFAPTGGLFGASSGAHILQNVGNETGLPRTPAGERINRNQVLPKALKRLPKLQKQNSRKDPPDLQFAIPPRKQADHLLSLYWDYVDSVYPWLERSLIESSYETLWVKDGELTMNETVLHCLLNLMFATSCVASQGERLLARYQSSVVFFERSQALMTYALIDLYNFEIIQVLLLTAVYLQHEKEPQKCFRIIGTAIHVAQELGLHIPETTEAMDNPKERDLARQVWNGCVVMDRICAMTFGCPLKVPRSVAEKGLNSLVLASMELSGESVTTSLPSKYNFYISFCRLHHIISEVLETFYVSGDSRSEHQTERDLQGWGGSFSSLLFDKFASLFRIESALNDWALNLHPFFQLPSELQDPTPTKHITREANILRARYLSVRLLLFRLLLLQIHQQRTDNAPGNGIYADDNQIMPHVVFQCQVNCTKAAIDMIEFIVRNSPEQKQAYILPSNWYTVSYVYMAVTNLLAAQSSPQIVEYFSVARLQGILQQARGILGDYEKHETLASRCSSVLKLVEQNIGRRESVAGLGSSEGSQVARGNDNTSLRDFVSGAQKPQATMVDPLAMVDNYTFDWNEWPMFFAQLDVDSAPADSWVI